MHLPTKFNVWIADIANQLPLYHRGTFASPDAAQDIAVDEVINWNNVDGVTYSQAVVSIWGAPEEAMVLVSPYPPLQNTESPIGAILSGVDLPVGEMEMSP